MEVILTSAGRSEAETPSSLLSIELVSCMFRRRETWLKELTLSRHVARPPPSHPSPERRLPLEAVILRGCHAGPKSDNESKLVCKITIDFFFNVDF